MPHDCAAECWTPHRPLIVACHRQNGYYCEHDMPVDRARKYMGHLRAASRKCNWLMLEVITTLGLFRTSKYIRQLIYIRSPAARFACKLRLRLLSSSYTQLEINRPQVYRSSKLRISAAVLAVMSFFNVKAHSGNGTCKNNI